MLKQLSSSLSLAIFSVTFCLGLSPVLAFEAPQVTENAPDFLMFMPAASWTKLLAEQLQNKSQMYQTTLTFFRAESQDKTTLVSADELTVKVNVLFKNLATIENGNLEAVVLLSQSLVNAEDLRIDLSLQKNIGFGMANLHATTTCRSAQIRAHSEAPIHLQVQQTNGQFQIQKLEWQLDKIVHETQFDSCSGTNGLEQELGDALDQALKTQVTLQILKKLLNQNLQQIVTEALSQAPNFLMERFRLQGAIQIHADSKNNLWIHGKNTQPDLFTPSERASLVAHKGLGFLIKKESLQSLLKNQINQELSTQILSSKENDNLKLLTCSRFIQFFVWPSLRWLDRCFEMRVPSRIESVDVSQILNNKIHLKVNSWALSDTHSLALFKTDLTLDLNHASVQINSFQGTSFPEYVALTHRSGRISTSIFQNSLRDWLEDKFTLQSKAGAFEFIRSGTILELTTDQSLRFLIAD